MARGQRDVGILPRRRRKVTHRKYGGSQEESCLCGTRFGFLKVVPNLFVCHAS